MEKNIAVKLEVGIGRKNMNVPFFDLKRQYELIREEIDDAIQTVLDSQRFIMEDEVQNFEDNVAKYCNCKHAYRCSKWYRCITVSC
jgi:hypothetical protein